MGLAGGVCNWPKGRALGGTSVINFMLYQRGHRRDFDNWAANGNDGWSYDDVLPYFKKSERIGIPELRDSKYHGRDGYLDVQRARFKTRVLDTFLKSANEFGYEVNDPNGESLLGFSHAQATTRNGRRCSAAKAFLRPVFHRPNLHISINSRVTKILIDPKSKTAYGVQFVKNRKVFQVKARKEVILSAGSIASPQLLMLSGVGPREHLKELRIPVIQDLRVGGYSLVLIILYFIMSPGCSISYRLQFTRPQRCQRPGLHGRRSHYAQRIECTEPNFYYELYHAG